jgi:hypothetical protein
MEGSVCKPEIGGGLARNPCHKTMFGFFDDTTNPRWIDEIINASVAMGIGVLTSFLVEPITGFSAGVTYSLLSSQIDLGHHAARVLTARPQRLARLARACPERIRRGWVVPGR